MKQAPWQESCVLYLFQQCQVIFWNTWGRGEGRYQVMLERGYGVQWQLSLCVLLLDQLRSHWGLPVRDTDMESHQPPLPQNIVEKWHTITGSLSFSERYEIMCLHCIANHHVPQRSVSSLSSAGEVLGFTQLLLWGLGHKSSREQGLRALDRNPVYHSNHRIIDSYDHGIIES